MHQAILNCTLRQQMEDLEHRLADAAPSRRLRLVSASESTRIVDTRVAVECCS
jgi:hypothetical protein